MNEAYAEYYSHMNKRKPGMSSLEEWEFTGMEINAMQEALKSQSQIREMGSRNAASFDTEKPGLTGFEDEADISTKEQTYDFLTAQDRLSRHHEAEKADLERTHQAMIDQAVEFKYSDEKYKDIQEQQMEEFNALLHSQEQESELLYSANDPHQMVTSILDGESYDHTEFEASTATQKLEEQFREQMQATQKLDENYRERMQATQLQQLDDLRHINTLHQDKLLSDEGLHQTLDAFVEEKKSEIQTLHQEHENNLRSLSASPHPDMDAKEMFQAYQHKTPDRSDDIAQEKHGEWLGDIHDSLPEAMKDARYFDTPAGAILAMPTQDYEINLTEHFENAQAMSNDNDLSMDR